MWNVRAATMAVLLITSASPVSAEENAIKLPLNDASQVVPRNVTVKAARYGGTTGLGFPRWHDRGGRCRIGSPEHTDRGSRIHRGCLPHRCGRRELFERGFLHSAD